MNRLLTICILSLCCAVQPVMAQNDPKAKTVLDAVTKKISGSKGIKASLVVRLTDVKGKVTDTKKGTVSLKGQKYHVALGGQEIICDTKTVWNYNKEAKEVQVSNYNPDEQTLSPAKLFTLNFYDKEYKYKYTGTKKLSNKDCDVIELVPVSTTKQFTKVELLIDKKTSTIAGGNIWQKNGSKVQCEINNFTPNSNIPDTYFTYDAKAHPGVEVVDLR
jgi:outer membrane lipoprotein carrier protein